MHATNLEPRIEPQKNVFRAFEGRIEEFSQEKHGFIERRYLLALARMAVEQYLTKGTVLRIEPWEAPSTAVTEIKACFVTINSNGNLRGCIGSLRAERPLMYDVIFNALRSAFRDERFLPLSISELSDVRFSISVLTDPTRLHATYADELLHKLKQAKHGLIICKGANMATYLPYVWRLIPSKEEFLSHLCIKAGLDKEEWREPGAMDLFTYEAQEFSE